MVELHITVRFPVSQLSSLNPQLNKDASRWAVNPFGSQARHFPYIAISMATQGETLPVAVYDWIHWCPLKLINL